MPHSSGGGSHGGGYHSSHSSSGGGSSGPRYSSRPYPGCHHYIYYYHGRARRYYGDQKIRAMSKKELFASFIVVIMFFLFSVAMIVFGGRVKPTKLTYAKSQTILIEDNINVLGDTSSLMTSLENFRETTGVVPAVLTITNDTWQVNYGSLEDYAYSKYLSMFSDESHWLVVYSVSESNADNWYYEFMQGDDTNDIISDHSFGDRNKALYNDLMGGKPLTESLIKVFENPENYMESYMQFEVIAIAGLFIVFSGIGAYAIINSYLSSRGRDDSYEISENSKEIKCDYCGGLFFDGKIERCPHCGAAILRNYWDNSTSDSSNGRTY